MCERTIKSNIYTDVVLMQELQRIVNADGRSQLGPGKFIRRIKDIFTFQNDRVKR